MDYCGGMWEGQDENFVSFYMHYINHYINNNENILKYVLSKCLLFGKR